MTQPISSVSARLARLVKHGTNGGVGSIQADAAQSAAAAKLDDVLSAVLRWPATLEEYRLAVHPERRREANGSAERMVSGGVATVSSPPLAPVLFSAPSLALPHGAFIHGSVGSGKTMLMDAFGSAAGAAPHVNVVRCHMNECAYVLHKRLAALDEQQRRKQQYQRNKRGSLAILSARRWRQFVSGRVDVEYRPSRPMRLAVHDVIRELGSHSAESVQLDPSQPRVTLLLLDEFQVSDTFTAIALKALFEVLWDENELLRSDPDDDDDDDDDDEDEMEASNVNVVVTTSNRNVDDDYDMTSGLGGDHMHMLLPKMRDHLISIHLSSVDHRHAMLARELHGGGVADDDDDGDARTVNSAHTDDDGMDGRAEEHLRSVKGYICGNDAAARAREVDNFWARLNGEETERRHVPLSYGRFVDISRHKSLSPATSVSSHTPTASACRLSFELLCGDDEPMGASDYMALAKAYSLIVVESVPVMSRKTANIARRFINFIDECYNNRTAVVLECAVEPDALFAADPADEHDSSLMSEDTAAPTASVEQLQFEGDSERQRLRTDVTAFGGTGILTPHEKSTSTSQSMTTQKFKYMLSGEDERFAFRRSVSRLKELQTLTYKYTSPKWRSVAPTLCN